MSHCQAVLRAPRRVAIAIHRAFRQDKGASAIEYAVAIGAIAATLVLAMEFMAPFEQQAFTTVAESMRAEKPGQTPETLVDAVAQAASTEVNRWTRIGLVVLTLGAVVFALVMNRAQARELEAEGAAEAKVAVAVEPQARYVEKRQQILQILGRDIRSLLGSRINVRQVMTDDVAHAPPEASVDDLRKLMADREVRHLLICDAQDQLVGVVSDRDLRSPKGETARQIMARNPQTISSDLPIGMAATLMLEKRISCLPVVDHDVVRGVVTMTDLAMTLQCMIQLLDRSSKRLIAGWELIEANEDAARDAEEALSALAR